MTTVALCGSFDDLRSPDIRFIEEAARLGSVHLLLWSDRIVEHFEGKSPKFPEPERRYFVDALKYVSKLTVIDTPFEPDTLPLPTGTNPAIWAVKAAADTPGKRKFAATNGIDYRVISDSQASGFPRPPRAQTPAPTQRKKVLVTGCYDWFHTGHVRFFEEVSEHGDLYVVAGNDANVEMLKGKGHPMFREDERCYLAGSIRFVKQALVSSGMGWLDAEPEIRVIKPDIYAVNEDGDKPEKREYCQKHGLQYLVLKRLPKEGLPRRQSTSLRGF